MQPHPRLKVGVFVVTSFFILVGGILWLAGSRFMRPVDTYHIVFDKSVSGLLPGARVEYQGVTVGKVKTLKLTREAPPKVDVIIDLKPGTPVRTDTSATLIGSLITNIRFVQLTGGSEKSAMLEEGGLIPAESTGFDEIQEQATVIAKQLTDTLAQVQRDVLTKDNIASIGTAIHDLALTSADLHHTLSMLATPRTVASLQALLANANQALIGIQQAAAVVSSLKGEVNSTMAELQKTVQHGDTLMKEASLTVGHLDLVVSQNQDELSRLLSNLADASLSLGQAGDVIRDDPSRLVWGNNLPVKEIPDK